MTTSQTTEYQKALKELEKASNELKALKKAYARLKKDYLELRASNGSTATTKATTKATAFEFIKTWTTKTKKHEKNEKESITLKAVMNAINNMKTDKEKETAMQQLESNETIKTPWYTIEKVVKKTNKKKGESKK